MNGSRNKRTLPRRIYRHIMAEYLVLLLCCLFGFLVLFLVTDIFNDLQDFLKAGADPGQTAAYFLMRQPMNLVYVLPMSVLLSLSFVVNNLIRHQELTAIRAAGLSIPAATVPVWVCAGGLAVGLFVLNEFAGPHLLRRASDLHKVISTDEGDRLKGRTACLASRNRAEKRDWFFEKFSHSGMQKGVSVKQFNPVKGGLMWELRAATAEYRRGRWIFYDGVRWDYSETEMLPEKEEGFATLVVPSLTESPSEIFNDLRPLRELSAFDILGILTKTPDLPDATARPLKATFWYRMTFPLSILVASLYGIGLSLRAPRAGAFRGFVSAVGMMVAYYLVTQLAVLMGKHGVIPGVLAAFVPNLAFLLHGGWVVYSRR